MSVVILGVTLEPVRLLTRESVDVTLPPEDLAVDPVYPLAVSRGEGIDLTLGEAVSEPLLPMVTLSEDEPILSLAVGPAAVVFPDLTVERDV